eukprot:scaffold173037_cov30-Tisochrysis_lutea.AAC.5
MQGGNIAILLQPPRRPLTYSFAPQGRGSLNPTTPAASRSQPMTASATAQQFKRGVPLHGEYPNDSNAL